MNEYKLLNKMNSSIIFIIILILLFQKMFTLILPFFTYLDEILIIFIVLIFMYDIFIRFKLDKYVFLIILCLIYMILISVYSNSSSLKNIVLQSLIHLKFFLFFYLFDKYLTFKQIKKAILLLFILTIAGIVINLILQEHFNSFLGVKIDYRNEMLRIVGFQSSPNLLGLTLGLYYIFFIFKEKIKLSNLILITLLFLVMIFITGSRNSLILPIIGIFFYYFSKSRKFKLNFVPIGLIIIFSFTIMVIYSDILERTVTNFAFFSNVSNQGYKRGIMIYYGFLLLYTYFPIGTGAATFGSVLSRGSSVYEELGLSKTALVLRMRGIYDSNLATIAGEFGFIGLLWIFILMKSITKRVANENNKFYVYSIVTTIVFSSFTNPIFMNSYPATLFSVFLVYARKREDYNECFSD